MMDITYWTKIVKRYKNLDGPKKIRKIFVGRHYAIYKYTIFLFGKLHIILNK